MVPRIKNAQKRLLQDNLHSSSIFIIIAQGIITVLGYLFWVLVSRLYPSDQVGIASSLISTSLLVAQASILGFNQSLIRFLPRAKDKAAMVNSSLLMTALASAILSTIVYASLKHSGYPNASLIYGLFFVITVILQALKTNIDSVFLANRLTKLNIGIYGVFGLIRIVLPIVLVAFGSMGIFTSNMLGLAISIILSYILLVKNTEYRFSPKLNWSILRKLALYSGASHIAGIFWVLPMMIVPTLVLSILGAQSAAYLYTIVTVFNILLILPTSTTQSLYAEGSHDDGTDFKPKAIKTLKFTYLVQLSGIAGLYAVGPLVLSAFGNEYASNGLPLLLSLIPISILTTLNMVGNTSLKVHDRITALLVINGLGAASTVVAFVILLPKYSLTGVAIGYGTGQAIMMMAHALLSMRYVVHAKRGEALVDTR